MAVDHSELIALQQKLQALERDIPEIMDRLVVQEGEYAVGQAKKICKEEGIVNLGDYRRNFKCGTKAIRTGNAYKIDVYNNLDYAGHLEYGFRGHFVPDKYLSGHYREEFPDGMYVHFHPGHHTLKRAIDNTKKSQDARLERKYLLELKKRGLDKYMK